jgi:stage III sporulation protein SpoIIIAA
VTDNLDELLAVLPPRIVETLLRDDGLPALLEVVCDLGRVPEARFPTGVTTLSEEPVSRDDLDYVAARVGQFNKDNRAGIERTLHRISALRNRMGDMVGVTCRVGRAVYGTIDVVREVIESGKSVLLVGRPGVGKTTLLREAGRVADDLDRRVMIVDPERDRRRRHPASGIGHVPHPGAARAAARGDIEAVENHMPEVVVTTKSAPRPALAARTIASAGAAIATAHGTRWRTVANPTSPIAAAHAVAGDDEARRRRTQKTVLSAMPPTFDVVVEIPRPLRGSRCRRRGRSLVAQRRGGAGSAHAPRRRRRRRRARAAARRRAGAAFVAARAHPAHLPLRTAPRPRRACRPRAAGSGDNRRDRRRCRHHFDLARHSEKASAPLARRRRRLGAHPRRSVEQSGQDRAGAARALRSRAPHPDQDEALREAEGAVIEVIARRHPVELAPRDAYLRRLQHQLANAYGLQSQSIGREPIRHVLIRPAGV